MQPGAGYNGGVVGQVQTSTITPNDLYYNDMHNATECGGAVTCFALGSNVPPTDAPYSSFDFIDTWTTDGGLQLQLPAGNLAGPSAPLSFVVSEGAGKTVMHLDWNAHALDGDYAFDEYVYEVKEADDTWETLVARSTTDATEADVYGLQLGHTYNIRVRTLTNYGGSDWAEQTFTTVTPVVHHISNCQQLQDFDSEPDTRYDTILLDQSFDCAEIENFVPLGKNEAWDGNDFEGFFDGQGHTISNLNISSEDYEVGLFASTYRATVQNATIGSGSIYGEGVIGGFVGDARDTIFTNLQNKAHIEGTSGEVGGIAGYAEYQDVLSTTLEKLSSEGDIYGHYEAGGIFGRFDIDEEGVQVVLKQSYSTGTVTVDAEEGDVGGLIGDVQVENDNNDGDPAVRFTIQDSYSWADVTGGSVVGGIIGYAETYNDGYETVANITLERTYSAGSITANNGEAGGIIGLLDDLSDEGLEVELHDSFVVGAVTGTNDAYALIGGSDGFLGGDGVFTMTNSWFDPGSVGQSSPLYDEVSGWDVSDSPDEFKNNSTRAPFTDPADDDAQLWDFTDIWIANEDTYPTFRSTPAEEEPVITDVNGDNIDDVDQPGVAGFTNGISGKTQAVELNGGCELDANEIAVREEKQFTVQDAGYDYSSSFVRFAANNCSASTITVKLFYYGLSGDFTVRKHNPNTNAYFNVPGATLATQTINNQQVLVVTYQIEDNGDLDLNKTDHEIVDPVGLGAAVVASPNTGFQQSNK